MGGALSGSFEVLRTSGKHVCSLCILKFRYSKVHVLSTLKNAKVAEFRNNLNSIREPYKHVVI